MNKNLKSHRGSTQRKAKSITFVYIAFMTP